MRVGALVVAIVVGGVGVACKRKEDRPAASAQASLDGPCAAERLAAANAWDRVASDLEGMREGIIAETVELELNEHAKLTNRLVNSPECAGMIGLFDNLVSAKDKSRWQKCNADAQAMNQVEDQMRRLMRDKVGLKAKQVAAAKEARELASRYRNGPISDGDAKRVYDRLLVYYGAASRVQSTGQHCLGNDCLSTPAAALIQYDIRPAQAAMTAATTACPKAADTVAAPAAAASPAAAPPQQPADEHQGGDEPCAPKLVVDPDPKGTGGNLRAGPGGDVLMEIPNCTEVCEIETEGEWRRVRASPRDVGYMHQSQLAEPNAARCKRGASAPAAKPATPKKQPPKPPPPPPPVDNDIF